MWESEVSVEVAAPVDAAYRFLADFPRHKEWSGGVVDLEQTTPGPIGVGTEFKASETVPVKMTTYSRITAVEPPRRIAWEAWDGRAMRVSWELELTARHGGTYLVERSRWQPTSLIGTIMLNLLRKRQVPKENRQSLERIKAILELATQQDVDSGKDGPKVSIGEPSHPPGK